MGLTVFPTLTFNTSTGSDTAASGAGPGTAVTGTGAAHTGGAATTTITFTNSPDLSGVAQDGSHVLWLKTASGRQFTRISTVDNVAKTCVVQDTFNIAAGSPVNYAIGAKRNSWDNADSKLLFTADAKSGWNVVTETDQTISASQTLVAAGDRTTGAFTITGSSGALRVITQSANTSHYSLANQPLTKWQNLKFANSNGTKTSANVFTSANTQSCWQDCTFGDSANLASGANIQRAFQNTTGTWTLVLLNCEIFNCATHAIDSNQPGSICLIGCRVRNCQGTGRGINVSGSTTIVVRDSIISGNGGAGIFYSATGGGSAPVWITDNVIHGNTSHGIDLTTGGGDGVMATITGNNITANGAYGISVGSSTSIDTVKAIIDYNNFGTGGTANTSGTMNGLTAGAHDQSVDPGYADAANGNFTAGTNIKAKGYPDATVALGNAASATTDYKDIGIQRQEPTGGGGPVGMSHIITNIGTY